MGWVLFLKEQIDVLVKKDTGLISLIVGKIKLDLNPSQHDGSCFFMLG